MSRTGRFCFIRMGLAQRCLPVSLHGEAESTGRGAGGVRTPSPSLALLSQPTCILGRGKPAQKLGSGIKLASPQEGHQRHGALGSRKLENPPVLASSRPPSPLQGPLAPSLIPLGLQRDDPSPLPLLLWLQGQERTRRGRKHSAQAPLTSAGGGWGHLDQRRQLERGVGKGGVGTGVGVPGQEGLETRCVMSEWSSVQENRTCLGAPILASQTRPGPGT